MTMIKVTWDVPPNDEYETLTSADAIVTSALTCGAWISTLGTPNLSNKLNNSASIHLLGDVLSASKFFDFLSLPDDANTEVSLHPARYVWTLKKSSISSPYLCIGVIR